MGAGMAASFGSVLHILQCSAASWRLGADCFPKYDAPPEFGAAYSALGEAPSALCALGAAIFVPTSTGLVKSVSVPARAIVAAQLHQAALGMVPLW